MNSSTPSEKLLAKLKEQGSDFFVSVPCKLLNEIIQLIEKDTDIVYTPVTREEEGMGILAGAYLAGKHPVILMQNSGIGNSLNAICSLLNYYHIPVILVISHRGTEGEAIEAQKPMGNATKALLAAADVEYYEISTVGELYLMDEGMSKANRLGKSAAFLFPFSFWK